MKCKLLIGILVISLAKAASAGTGGTGPRPAEETSAVFKQYCVSCHNAKVKTAGLALDGVNVEKVQENPDVWEKVVRKLRAGAMPPAGSPRPAPEVYNSTVSWLETELDRTAQQNPGRPALRRLNRA